MSGDNDFDPDVEELRKRFWSDDAGPKADTGTPKAATGTPKGNGVDGSGWGEPEPLISPRGAELPYPIAALPRLLRNAVLEYQELSVVR